MTTFRRFLFASLGGLVLLASAITATVRAELTMVTPEGRSYACKAIRYDTGSRVVLCDEAAMFSNSFEGVK